MMCSEFNIPEVSFLEFVFKDYEQKISTYKDRPWIIDVPSGRTVTFGQVKRDATKIASALARMGFAKGDVLYFVTYELAHLYLVHISVWMLGGVMRGCFQGEAPDAFAKQMRESGVKFVLVDSETIGAIKSALLLVDFEVQMLSLGSEKLEGTVHFTELLEDDGSALPHLTISDPKSERLVILNTSGSTGYPKGVVHTHYSAVAYVKVLESVTLGTSILEFMINYGVGVFGFAFLFLMRGHTLYHINKFERSQYFKYLMEYQPKSVLMYPFVANWFSRCELEMELLRDANFLHLIMIGGWVLDPVTADLIVEKLPNTFLEQVYGMTEICFTTCCKMGDKPAKLDRCVSKGQIFTSSGMFLPNVQGKILDMSTGEKLAPHSIGELYVKSPTNCLGYLTSNNQIDSSEIIDGWMKTGDVGFMDEKGNLYIKDRAKFIYKYKAVFVLPSEIESTLQEHPDIQESGVVNIPDLATNNLSRAFVVLKPGRKCTAQEICDFIANKLPEYKHLHGGVRFVENLPVGKGGKLDRKALKDLALASS